MTTDLKSKDLIETKVADFYDSFGWSDASDQGTTNDADLWEDLRPCAQKYVSDCRKRVQKHIPKSGGAIVDAASGPIQYEEYFNYSAGYGKRICVDISEKALELARLKLGDKGTYLKSSILDLPIPTESVDAAISLHTIYHIDKDHQVLAVRELLRILRPGAPLVVVYSNPQEFVSCTLQRLREWGLLAPPPKAKITNETLYFFPHTLSWWQQFVDTAYVQIFPWRSVAASTSQKIIPNNRFGRLLFRGLYWLEEKFPNFMARHGVYPMIVLKKKEQNQ